MTGDGETVTPLLPEPGVWTGMASANVWAPLRWKHAKIHQGSAATSSQAASRSRIYVSSVQPGTELAFAHEVKRLPARLWAWRDQETKHTTAIFRQINKEKMAAHHDALEFPDEGQQASVLQLPAEPKAAIAAEAQRQTAYVG